MMNTPFRFSLKRSRRWNRFHDSGSPSKADYGSETFTNATGTKTVIGPE